MNRSLNCGGRAVILAMSTRMLNLLYGHWGIHLCMLSDRVRMNAYAAAITAAVTPGDVVVDIGTGTGILAFLAARRRAKRVYAIERTGMICMGRELARDNGLQNVVEFLEGDSRDVTIPERADVVISELLGLFALDEDMLDVLRDARKRFLKPSGVILPCSIVLYVVPVQSEAAFEQTIVRRQELFGLDFKRLEAATNGSLFAIDLGSPEVQFLGPPQALAPVDLTRHETSRFAGDALCSIETAGVLHGFGGWWEATLYEDFRLSTDPRSDRSPAAWMQAFFPLRSPRKVHAGSLIVVDLKQHIEDGESRWSYALRTAGPRSDGTARVRRGIYGL